MKKKLSIIALGISCFAILMFSGLGYENIQSVQTKNLLALQDASAQMANKCCPIWDITYTYKFTGVEIECSTGGQYQCEDCLCPDSMAEDDG